jgi:hypothetical protein
VPAEGPHLGVEFRIEPIRFRDRGAEVVQHQPLGHAAEVPEGVLQAAQEGLGALAAHHFAVGFAGVAQDDAEDMRPAARTAPS